MAEINHNTQNKSLVHKKVKKNAKRGQKLFKDKYGKIGLKRLKETLIRHNGP